MSFSDCSSVGRSERGTLTFDQKSQRSNWLLHTCPCSVRRRTSALCKDRARRSRLPATTNHEGASFQGRRRPNYPWMSSAFTIHILSYCKLATALELRVPLLSRVISNTPQKNLLEIPIYHDNIVGSPAVFVNQTLRPNCRLAEDI